MPPRAKSPARSPKPPPKTVVNNNVRPCYYSDDDTRPVCRGWTYSVLRESKLFWLLLVAYPVYALYAQPTMTIAALLARLGHSVVLAANAVLSDDLHNLDLKLGAAYGAEATWAATAKLECYLHACDFRGVAAIIASYHVVLVAAKLARPEFVDVALLWAHLGALAFMCFRVSANAIRGAYPQAFLLFAGTIGLQMVLVLAGFLRFGSTPYVLLWLLYGVGMLAKPLEFAPPGSSPDVFGHHEVMHAVVLLANFLGLAADCWTM